MQGNGREDHAGLRINGKWQGLKKSPAKHPHDKKKGV